MQELIIPGSLIFLCIGSLIAVRVEMTKRPTFKYGEEHYQEQKVCEQIQKNITDKIQHIPEMRDRLIGIETKLDILITNGKK